MNDAQSIHDDISYLRRLAESGRKGPILGGAFLAGAGVVFGGACFISWIGSQGLLSFGSQGELYLWLGAFAVFALFWLVMFLRLRGRETARATASTAIFGTIWSACGAGVMVAYVSTLIVAQVTKAPVVLTAYIPVIFAFYGTAWFATGAAAKRSWMFLAGAVSFAIALVMALLSQQPLQVLVMGFALLVLLTLPGLKLVADEADERK